MADVPESRRHDSHDTGGTPVDLLMVIGTAILSLGVMLIPGMGDTLVRVGLGFMFVMFIPGYALVSVLFPATEASGLREDGITDGERLLLSVGLSLFSVPLVSLFLNFSNLRIQQSTVLVSLAVLTIGAAVVGIVRRRAVPPTDRFTVRPRERIEAGLTWVTGGTTTDLALNVLIAVGVVLMVSGGAWAVAEPKQGETYTEFYLLTENESGAGLVADDYPTTFERGEPKSFYVGLENHEGNAQEYTVVVELQRTSGAGNETVVLATEELERVSVAIANNETWQREHSLEPTMTGEDLRLTYLLYRGTPPADPSTESAYRYLHVWVDVED